MRLIDADELITAFPCGESIRTESVRATINNMPTIDIDRPHGKWKVRNKNDSIRNTFLSTDQDSSTGMGVRSMLYRFSA